MREGREKEGRETKRFYGEKVRVKPGMRMQVSPLYRSVQVSPMSKLFR